MLVEEVRHVFRNEQFFKVQGIDQALEESDDGFRATEIDTTPTQCGPIRRLYIFDGIDAVGAEQWKQDEKRLYHVGVEVAAVIDDDIEAARLVEDPPKKLFIGLISLMNDYPAALVDFLFMDVDAMDDRVGKILLPHA